MALTFFSATAFAADLAAVEKVQALIDALPEADAVTAENRTETEAWLTAIDTAKAALTDEERDALDFTRYQVVIAALDALDGMPDASTPTVLDDTSDLQGKLENGGTVTLDKDYTITNVLTIKETSTVTLDLNGHVLKMTGNDCVICIKDGGSLTLKDSAPNASHSGDYAELPEGGVITGGKGRKDNSQTRYGGGVYNDAQKDGGQATFTMENGKITGNSATSGGGVYNYAANGCEAKFIMKGGEITGNSATFRAGGVFKTNLTRFVISGNATVTDNTQDGTASNLYMLPGGTIVIESETTFTGSIGVRMDNYNSDAVIISGGGLTAAASPLTMQIIG